VDRPQRLARKSEEKTAELHGAKLTPGSGSRNHTKNDAANEKWSYEVKSTSAKGYRLEHETLVTADHNAALDGHTMALIVDFIRSRGSVPSYVPRRFVVMTEDDFLEREQDLARLHEAAEAWDAERSALNDELRRAEQELEFLRKDNAELLHKIMTDC
jgi:hypothetical protein